MNREDQGRGIGSLLLVTVFELAHERSRTVGCGGVVFDAKTAAVPFDRRFGFRSMVARSGALGDRPEPTPMFLPRSALPKRF